MPFDFFDGLNIIGDLLNFGSSLSSSSTLNHEKKPRKKSKYKIELWSGSFLLMASILYFFLYKEPLPKENLLQTILLSVLVGFALSFVVFFALYHLNLFYFKSIGKFLLFTVSFLLFAVSVVLMVYFNFIIKV
jgi:hypothetical protein